jgi:hypothetical protein
MLGSGEATLMAPLGGRRVRAYYVYPGVSRRLTLLDVEHLAGALRASEDWNQGLARYAAEHNEYYAALHRILGWMTELTWTTGPEADERRQRVFPRMMSDPHGFRDPIGIGPFGPNDEPARRLLLGLG